MLRVTGGGVCACWWEAFIAILWQCACQASCWQENGACTFLSSVPQPSQPRVHNCVARCRFACFARRKHTAVAVQSSACSTVQSAAPDLHCAPAAMWAFTRRAPYASAGQGLGKGYHTPWVPRTARLGPPPPRLLRDPAGAQHALGPSSPWVPEDRVSLACPWIPPLRHLQPTLGKLVPTEEDALQTG